MPRAFWLTSMGLMGLSGCAHSYFYTPEVAGEGAKQGRGGVVFQVPPGNPAFRMKLTSLGVTSMPPEAKVTGSDPVIQVRVFFARTAQATAAPIMMEPSEIKLELPSGGERVAPLRVARIVLSAAPRQAVDLWFPLPAKSRGANDVQSFSVRWKVHYGTLASEEHLTRFDRHDRRPEQGAALFPWDSDFPYDLSPILPPGWAYEPWY